LGKCPLFNKASNNKRFIYFYYAIATRDFSRKVDKISIKHLFIYE